MKKLFLLLFAILISFNSYGETKSYYYSNGQIESEINYKDGKEDGKTTYWDENGRKWKEGNYKDGKLDGKRTWWYENDQISDERNY